MTHVGAPCRMLAQHSTRRRSQSAQGYSGTLANHSRMLTDPSSGCSSASYTQSVKAEGCTIRASSGDGGGVETGGEEALTRST